MSENYYLISDNDVHMPIRCALKHLHQNRKQKHD